MDDLVWVKVKDLQVGDIVYEYCGEFSTQINPDDLIDEVIQLVPSKGIVRVEWLDCGVTRPLWDINEDGWALIEV